MADGSLDPLLMAVLAIDSYSPRLAGAIVGDATVIQASSTKADSPEVAAGFYAAAYQLPDGSIVISYRGATSGVTVRDILNGWPLGAGDAYAAQAQLAVQFYQQVSQQFPGATISVTGHSLGGGLAGFVGSLFGLNGTLFDSMNYAGAANELYQDTLSGAAGVPTDATIGAEMEALSASVYGTGAPWPPNASGLSAYAVNGEILSSLGIGVGALGTGQLLDPGGSAADGVVPNGLDLHSAALLVCLQYASENGLTQWQSVGADSSYNSALLLAMFNDSIGTALGFQTTLTAGPSAQMLTDIAYSALSSGTMPFGDTGLPALFAGADALGQIYGASTPPSALLTGIKDDLADINVEYAGWLAKNADANSANAVSDIQDTAGALTIDLSSATWSTNCGPPPALSAIVGLSDLITQAISDSGATSEINAQIAKLWNGSSAQFDRILIASGSGAVTLDATALGDLSATEGALIVGNDGGDTITGTSGDDLIIGGSGNDTINVGSGSDIVYAGGGDDTIKLTASSSASASSIDFIDGGKGDNTLEFGAGATKTGVDLTLSTVQGADGAVELQASGPGFATVDMTNIQTIELPDDGDTVTIGANFEQLTQNVAIKGVLQPEPSADTLDLSAYSHAPEMLQTASGSQSFGGVDLQGDSLLDANISVSNFEVLKGTNEGDYVDNVSGFKNIDLGNGNNYVGSVNATVLPGDQGEGPEAGWAIINMGSGASTLAGSIPAGSVVNLGAGHSGDQIVLSSDTEINGANSSDTLYLNGAALTGAVENSLSATPWLINSYTQTEYKLDQNNVLEVHPMWAGTGATFGGEDPSTYITGFANSPDANAPTAGNIHLVSYGVSAHVILDAHPTPPPGGTELSVFQLFLHDIMQALLGTQFGADPMILDLSGKGIALSPVDSGAAPSLALGDTEFSMPVSWVNNEEGVLVELNQDGTVTSGQNFVGGPTGDGFAPLAAYDANGDGVVDQSDLASAADADLPQLRIWVDSNGDGQAQAGELLTLAQAGVLSISLTETPASNSGAVANATLLSTGSFIRADGTTGAIDDLDLLTDPYHSTFLGDASVTPLAAALPDIAGHGSLPDLRVALSLDESAQFASGALTTGSPSANEIAVAAAQAQFPSAPDLDAWVQAIAPVLAAWTSSFADPNPAVDAIDSAALTPVTQDFTTGALFDLVQPNGNGGQETVDTLAYQYSLGSITMTSRSGVSRTLQNQVTAGDWVTSSGQVFQSFDAAMSSAGEGKEWIALPSASSAFTVPVLTNGQKVETPLVLQMKADGSLVRDGQGMPIWRLAEANGAQSAGGTFEQAFFSASSFGMANSTSASGSVSSGQPTSPSDSSSRTQSSSAEPVDPHHDVYMVVQTDSRGVQSVVDFLTYVQSSNTSFVWDQSGIEGVSATSGYWMFDSGLYGIDGAPSGDRFYSLQAALDTPLASQQSWSVLTVDEQDFLERYTGEPLPIGVSVAGASADTYGATLGVLNDLENVLNLTAVAFAMQGPLASTVFAGLTYDPTTQMFVGTTPLGIEPVYQAIFASAAASADALGVLQAWTPIVSVVLANFDPGPQVVLNAAYLLANVVAAWEATGLQVSLAAAADAMGFDSSMLVAGDGSGSDWAISDGDTDPETPLNPNTVDVWYIRGSSTNFFYVGPGDHLYQGSNGDNSFVVGARFGNSVVETADGVLSSDYSLVRFASIASTDIQASSQGADLVLTDTVTGDTLRITNELTDPEVHNTLINGNLATLWGVQEVDFADGVVWDMAQIAQEVMAAPVANAALVATWGSDDFTLAQGDTVTTGDGSHTLFYNLDSGSTTINIDDYDSGQIKWDGLEFGPGITLNDLSFTRDGDSDNLTITVNSTGATILIEAQFNALSAPFVGMQWYDQIDQFIFSDGSSLSADQVRSMILQQEEQSGGPIYGFGTNDVIDPGVGDKLLDGNDGNDTYIYKLGYGHDTISITTGMAFMADSDTVAFGAGITQSNIQLSRPMWTDDLLITMPDGGTLTIHNEFKPSIFTSISTFDFSDGTSLTRDQMIDLQIAQAETQGNITIVGAPRPTNVFNDPNGAVTFVGGYQGGNVYTFGRGYGADTIEQATGIFFTPLPNQVIFEADISPSDVAVSMAPNGTSVVLTIKGTNDSLTVVDGVANVYGDAVPADEYVFSDGTTWTGVDLAQQLLQGQYSTTAGNVSIFDASGAEYCANDNLTLSDINSTDAEFLQFGANLVVVDVATGKIVTIESQFTALGQGQIADFTFADGVALTAAELEQKTFGVLKLSEFNAADLTFSRTGNDLLISENASGRTITIGGEFSSSNKGGGVQSVQFADGTTWDWAQIVAAAWYRAGPGDVTLAGPDGAGTMQAGSGDDVFNVGDEYDTGQTTIVYAASDGDLVINAHVWPWDTISNVLQLTDLSPSDLTFSRSGNDLSITVNSTAT